MLHVFPLADLPLSLATRACTVLLASAHDLLLVQVGTDHRLGRNGWAKRDALEEARGALGRAVSSIEVVAVATHLTAELVRTMVIILAGVLTGDSRAEIA